MNTNESCSKHRGQLRDLASDSRTHQTVVVGKPSGRCRLFDLIPFGNHVFENRRLDSFQVLTPKIIIKIIRQAGYPGSLHPSTHRIGLMYCLGRKTQQIDSNITLKYFEDLCSVLHVLICFIPYSTWMIGNQKHVPPNFSSKCIVILK